MATSTQCEIKCKVDTGIIMKRDRATKKTAKREGTVEIIVYYLVTIHI